MEYKYFKKYILISFIYFSYTYAQYKEEYSALYIPEIIIKIVSSADDLYNLNDNIKNLLLCSKCHKNILENNSSFIIQSYLKNKLKDNFDTIKFSRVIHKPYLIYCLKYIKPLISLSKISELQSLINIINLSFLKKYLNSKRALCYFSELLDNINNNVNISECSKQLELIIKMGCLDLPPIIQMIYAYPIIINLLIKYKYDINVVNKYGYNLLLYASKYNHIKIVKKLIKAGANINIQNFNGETALILSINKHNDQIAKRLIRAKADPFLKTNNQLNAFYYMQNSHSYNYSHLTNKYYGRALWDSKNII